MRTQVHIRRADYVAHGEYEAKPPAKQRRIYSCQLWKLVIARDDTMELSGHGGQLISLQEFDTGTYEKNHGRGGSNQVVGDETFTSVQHDLPMISRTAHEFREFCLAILVNWLLDPRMGHTEGSSWPRSPPSCLHSVPKQWCRNELLEHDEQRGAEEPIKHIYRPGVSQGIGGAA